LRASLQAAYGKLARVPLSLSQGFLAEASQRLRLLFPPLPGDLPRSLQAMQAFALDGKKVKHVARRLKPTRRLNGQLFGGKLVVGLHLNSRLALAFACHPDGQYGDTPLVPALLAQLRPAWPGVRLWLGDRLFCDLKVPALLAAGGDHFLLRYCAKASFHADPARPARQGADARGRLYVEGWGWLGQGGDPRRRYVRRVTLSRPGEEDVTLVTDLLDGQAYPAEDLLEVYLRRWAIEGCFQQVTEVFGLAPLIGNTPEATVFQASFCLLLYDVVLTLRGYLAEAQAKEPEVISGEQLFTDVKRQLVAWEEVLTPEATPALLGGRLSASGLQGRLRELLRGVWSDRWLKAPRRKTPPPKQPPRRYIKGGHTSVFRLLQQARQEDKEKTTG
jgi:hypothetical protein